MRYGSRKFIVACLGILVPSVLRYLGSIESVAWSTVVTAAITGYLAVNVWQKSQKNATAS